ncbi:BlaI/MecI/CopY family transcriptional regulator [Wenjunlia tyrosinilytica]|uniref:BlaI/MecI/CopY family transcriptional regulator n=1 Tax=Wenjunlia tyrosinilytica TaxID=1544741 RepID=UPI00166DF7EE|nr:BlaI/MecI/CopY family transcriptional regulator [Wenjunlia tyrosinilytica]
MSDVLSKSQSLQAEYEARVAADLRQNEEGHERVTAQIASLQEELEVLRRDREMLVSMRNAVGTLAPEATGEAATDQVESVEEEPKAKAQVPKPRRQGAKKAAPSRGRKSARGAKKDAKSSGADTADAKEAPQSSKLIELVEGCLVRQSGPMSAAEIAAAVATPERPVTVISVRTALEGLVRKAAAHRSKQGRSVYYEPVSGAAGASSPTGQTDGDAEAAS